MSGLIPSEQPTGVTPTNTLSLPSPSNPSGSPSATSGAGSASLEVQFDGLKDHLGFQLSSFAAHPGFTPDGADQQGFPDTVPTSPAQSFPGPSASQSRSVSPFSPSEGGLSSSGGRRKTPVMVLSDPDLGQPMIRGPDDSSPPPPKIFKDQASLDKYLRRRAKNNEAATKSRKKKRELEEANFQKAKELADENSKLKEELQALRAETRTLKDMLSMMWQSKK